MNKDIKVKIGDYSGYEFEGTPEKIIEFLQFINKRAAYGEYSKLELSYEKAYNYDDSYSFVLYGTRKETNEEKQLRLKKEKEKKKTNKEYRRKQFEALQKEFSQEC